MQDAEEDLEVAKLNDKLNEFFFSNAELMDPRSAYGRAVLILDEHLLAHRVPCHHVIYAWICLHNHMRRLVARRRRPSSADLRFCRKALSRSPLSGSERVRALVDLMYSASLAGHPRIARRLERKAYKKMDDRSGWTRIRHSSAVALNLRGTKRWEKLDGIKR